jgi:hypothetical protein
MARRMEDYWLRTRARWALTLRPEVAQSAEGYRN